MDSGSAGRRLGRQSTTRNGEFVNIVLLGHADLASLYALNDLIARSPGHHYTAFDSGTLTAKQKMPGALIDLAALDAKLCTEHRDTGKLSEVLLRARELPKPNSPAGLNTLGDCDPDLIVSIRYRQILRDDAIAVPRQGVLNLHSGILPDYRGVMATFWAMLNAELEIGSTLHRIVDSGIDTGPILGVSRTPLRPGETYLANLLRLYADGVAMLVEAIAELECGNPLEGSPQSTECGKYFSTPDEASIKAFSAKNLCLASALELDLILASIQETRQKSVINESLDSHIPK